MQYVWQHRLWPCRQMLTVDGRVVQVIDQGRLNTDAGPDFFNAKVKIGGEMWAGDVEIHVRASDWHRHGHHNDRAYDSVILHVVGKDDTPVTRPDGRVIPQLCLECSPDFRTHYDRLVGAPAGMLPCAEEIKRIHPVHLHAWLDSLAYERIYAKEDRIRAYLDRLGGDWEAACYVALARALGFGINSEPFERLALSLPLSVAGKHSDSQLALDALLFGQAGFLDNLPEGDTYAAMLRSEYGFLAHKFGLRPPGSLGWKMARMRPQNFPHRRIAFLSAMLFGGFKLMSRIIAAHSAEEMLGLFSLELMGYWSNHFTFGSSAAAERSGSVLSRSSMTSLAINVGVPMMRAYAAATDDTPLAERAMEMLHSLRAETNSVTAAFAACGLKCDDAFTSQALIQLRREYCDTRKCLYCRIGHRMLSRYSCRPQPTPQTIGK